MKFSAETTVEIREYNPVYCSQCTKNESLHLATTIIQSATCFPPVVELFPRPPNNTEAPLQFRRSQDFYITAIIKRTCAASLEMETKWSIFNCTPNCSVKADIDPSISTTFSEIYFPARSLIYGHYQFQLRVTMLKVPSMSTTAYTFVKINPSGITANLVKYGTSLVTSGQHRNLTLNPGHHSKNPDEKTFNASVSVRNLNSWNFFSPFNCMIS